MRCTYQTEAGRPAEPARCGAGGRGVTGRDRRGLQAPPPPIHIRCGRPPTAPSRGVRALLPVRRPTPLHGDRRAHVRGCPDSHSLRGTIPLPPTHPPFPLPPPERRSAAPPRLPPSLHFLYPPLRTSLPPPLTSFASTSRSVHHPQDTRTVLHTPAACLPFTLVRPRFSGPPFAPILPDLCSPPTTVVASRVVSTRVPRASTRHLPPSTCAGRSWAIGAARMRLLRPGPVLVLALRGCQWECTAWSGAPTACAPLG